jgi:hypothetical protein
MCCHTNSATVFPSELNAEDGVMKLEMAEDYRKLALNPFNVQSKAKVKQSLYTPWRRLGREEV